MLQPLILLLVPKNYSCNAKAVCCIAFIMLTCFAHGQTPTWIKYHMGHTDGLCIDTLNDRYTGLNRDVHAETSPLLLNTYSNQGLLVQSKPVNASNGYSMIQTSDGGFLFLNPSNTFANFYDTLVKVNSNGEVQWKTLQPSSVFNVILVEDHQQNYLLVSRGGVVTKVNSSGLTVWTKTYSYFSPTGITHTASGYMIGGYSGSQIVLIKTDLNGDTILSHRHTMNGSAISFLNTPEGGFLAFLDGNWSVGYTYRIDADGELVWSKQTNNIPMTVYGNYFFARESYYKIAKMALSNGDISWTFSTNNSMILGLSAHKDGGVIAACSTHVPETETKLIRLDKDGILRMARIKGRVVKDLNNNCQQELSEGGRMSILVKAEPGPLYTYTDYFGDYEFLADTGIIYTVSPMIQQEHLLENNCQTSSTMKFTSYDQESSANDFMLKRIDCPDLKVYYPISSEVRCFKGSHKLKCINLGNVTAQNVELSLEIPSALVVKSTSVPYVLQGNKLVFQAGNIAKDAMFEVLIQDSISCDAPLDKRYPVRSIAKSSSICPIPNSTNDTTISILSIVGSFDPNDKQVFPEVVKYSDYSAGEKTLRYMIRFQNTGSSPAVNIKIIDTIPVGLNFATISDITSSHYTMWQVIDKDKTIIHFNFLSIKLPSKNLSESASQGYVSFTIDLADGLPDGTSVTNKAAIYFDYNEPVITEAAIVSINSNPTERYRANFASVLLTSPSNNTSFLNGTNIGITANVFDPDQVIAKVEFYEGNTLLATALTAPYAFEWTGASEGLHTIIAKATDNDSKTYSSQLVSFTMKPYFAEIALTSPADNAVLAYGTDVAITTTVSDPDQIITKVEFYEGNVLVGTALTAPYGFEWTSVLPGAHTIIAKAIDSEDNVYSSQLIHFTMEDKPTGILSSHNRSLVSIQPNPFTTSATISLNSADKVLFACIYDVNGKQVQELATLSDLSFGEKLQPGVYTVFIVTNNQSISKGIIKLP